MSKEDKPEADVGGRDEELKRSEAAELNESGEGGAGSGGEFFVYDLYSGTVSYCLERGKGADKRAEMGADKRCFVWGLQVTGLPRGARARARMTCFGQLCQGSVYGCLCLGRCLAILVCAEQWQEVKHRWCFEQRMAMTNSLFAQFLVLTSKC